MRTPTDLELAQLRHAAVDLYDPVKAHKYYEEHKKLKGRKSGQIQEDEPGWDPKTMGNKRGRLPSSQDPRTGFSMKQIHLQAKARQRGELMAAIERMGKKLKALEAKIKELEHKEASEDRKGKAKKERAAKEADKPDTAAEKADKAREAKKDRAKNQQSEKSKAKEASDKSGGGSSSKKKSGSKKIHELKALATKMKGQIAVAKQKLAAL